MIHARRIHRREWRAYRDLRLRALRDSPDAFGSTFARESRRPDEEWIARVEAVATSAADLPHVAVQGYGLVGLAWGQILPTERDVAHVFQMWVAPENRGLRIGSELLTAIIVWARESQVQRVVLGVTCGDTPARRLYERAGFRPAGPLSR